LSYLINQEREKRRPAWKVGQAGAGGRKRRVKGNQERDKRKKESV
jgi:hypothetical protein